MVNLSVRQLCGWMIFSAVVAVGLTGLGVWGLAHLPTAKAAGTETKNRRLPGIADPATSSDERNNIEVYRATAPGNVFITTAAGGRILFDSDDREGTGSGVAIDEQGHILTNEHVLSGTQRVTVKLSDNCTYPARIVSTDPDSDLAVLKIEAPREQLTVIPMADSDQLTVGQKVLAIGNPFGLDRTVSTGVISGLQRPIHTRNQRLIEGAIQRDASINPGNSGGALLDSQGRLIGINTMIYSPTGGSVGVGFAIPTNIAKRIVPQLISNGRERLLCVAPKVEPTAVVAAPKLETIGQELLLGKSPPLWQPQNQSGVSQNRRPNRPLSGAGNNEGTRFARSPAAQLQAAHYAVQRCAGSPESIGCRAGCRRGAGADSERRHHLLAVKK